MSETFHPFPRLPAELRLAIWKLAIRPGGKTLPGVHFFGIVIPGEDADADSLMNQAVAQGRLREHREYELVGPRWTTAPTEDRFVGIKHEPASWTDNNPSTYLIDCGLWMACKESRHVIEAALFHGDWTKVLVYNNVGQRPKSAKDRLITAFLDQDLFCFQPYDWYTFELGFVNFLNATFKSVYGPVKNIAIEYNPQWGVEVEEVEGDHEFLQIINQFFHIAISTASISDVEAVWFIDYRIKRRHHVPTKKQSEAPLGDVFYQDGRRLVEVDIEFEDSPWELSYEIAEDKWASCKPFVLALRQTCLDHLDNGEKEYSFGEEDEAPFLGVLACVED